MLRSTQTCDHKVQIVNLDYSFNKIPPGVHSFRNCHWDELCYILHCVPWDIMYSFDDIYDQWAFFILYWKSVLIAIFQSNRFALGNLKGQHHGSQMLYQT